MQAEAVNDLVHVGLDAECNANSANQFAGFASHFAGDVTAVVLLYTI